MTRYAIHTAFAFDATEPEFLLIEYGEDGIGRCVGQHFDIGGAMKQAHERRTGANLDQVSEKRLVVVR